MRMGPRRLSIRPDSPARRHNYIIMRSASSSRLHTWPNAAQWSGCDRSLPTAAGRPHLGDVTYHRSRRRRRLRASCAWRTLPSYVRRHAANSEDLRRHSRRLHPAHWRYKIVGPVRGEPCHEGWGWFVSGKEHPAFALPRRHRLPITAFPPSTRPRLVPSSSTKASGSPSEASRNREDMWRYLNAIRDMWRSTPTTRRDPRPSSLVDFHGIWVARFIEPKAGRACRLADGVMLRRVTRGRASSNRDRTTEMPARAGASPSWARVLMFDTILGRRHGHASWSRPPPPPEFPPVLPPPGTKGSDRSMTPNGNREPFRNPNASTQIPNKGRPDKMRKKPKAKTKTHHRCAVSQHYRVI